jgi:membrane protease YdiL (CAAX protease family)
MDFISGFYKNTIFFAADNTAIAAEKQRYNGMHWLRKIGVGCAAGRDSFITSCALAILWEYATAGIDDGQPATIKFEETPVNVLAIAILVEEAFMRGAPQYALAKIQGLAQRIAPQREKENTVFKWITSPSSRILTIGSLFAGMHLYNSGGLASTKGALFQCCHAFLLPTCSILHETTGNILAPIAAHATHNFILHGALKLNTMMRLF